MKKVKDEDPKQLTPEENEFVTFIANIIVNNAIKQVYEAREENNKIDEKGSN